MHRCSDVGVGAGLGAGVGAGAGANGQRCRDAKVRWSAEVHRCRGVLLVGAVVAGAGAEVEV